jgi:tetratricopeptide (TPR) repeat protein
MGTKKQSGNRPADAKAKTNKNGSPAGAVVVSGGAGRAWYGGIPVVSRLTRKGKLIAGAVVLLLAVLIVGMVWHNQSVKLDGKQLPTPDQAASDTVKDLESTPPAESTSAGGKADYYRRLSYAQAAVENYQAAITALNQAISISPRSMDYTDYMNLARYYHAAGDNKRALQALSIASDAAPKTVNENTGYNPAYAKATIDELRQEYSQ